MAYHKHQPKFQSMRLDKRKNNRAVLYEVCECGAKCIKFLSFKKRYETGWKSDTDFTEEDKYFGRQASAIYKSGIAASNSRVAESMDNLSKLQCL